MFPQSILFTVNQGILEIFYPQQVVQRYTYLDLFQHNTLIKQPSVAIWFMTEVVSRHGT